jgi:hypothetical protein
MALGRDTGFLIVLTLLYAAAALAIVLALMVGWSYYTSPFATRPHLDGFGLLRPGGKSGHGYGMVGSALMLLLLLYSARKRWRAMASWGNPSKWLDVHICFGIVGPLLIVLHTSFKVHGLIAVSFWSMVAVALSGVFGRWLYLQIPRNIQGQELSRQEIGELERDLAAQTATASRPRQIARLARRRARLERNLRSLETVRRFFHYWHVIHRPFAIIMLLIMGVHVAITVALGYRWVF